ncbi:hypothetical protein [Pediococcus pentosaceus]|uniref:hypothetical protein n=1 Tax=Pediococcus pentosaceus TaxID=1255 RepID=UPI00104F919B|nr:hypothetical protein [Pediococcus pentosaceus]
MTTFDDIRNNALGYRNDFNRLNQLMLKLSAEKAKGDPLVAWFRLRNRRVAQVLDPMKEELKLKTKEGKRKVVSISQSTFAIRKVQSLVAEERLSNATRALNKIVEPILNETVQLSNDADQAIDQINEVNSKIKAERNKLTNDIAYYEMSEKNCDRVKELFTSTRTTKDIDIPAFSEGIRSINDQIKMLDIDVPALKELPKTYDKQTVDSIHEEIRSVVQTIDSRYPMKIFAKAVRTLRIIIHDVSNDRGKKAFRNRSDEILMNTNEAIQIFNAKYWQITGQRWERVGTNQWGYRSVKATHQPIEKI